MKKSLDLFKKEQNKKELFDSDSLIESAEISSKKEKNEEISNPDSYYEEKEIFSPSLLK